MLVLKDVAHIVPVQGVATQAPLTHCCPLGQMGEHGVVQMFGVVEGRHTF
jgi:hypothetical protein